MEDALGWKGQEKEERVKGEVIKIEKATIAINKEVYERFKLLKAEFSAKEGQSLTWDEFFKLLLKKERKKKELTSWLYTLGIFIAVTFILLFPLYIGAPLMVPLFLLFGFIVAVFSTYVLTPWTLRKIKPFGDAPSQILESLEELSGKAEMKKQPKLMIAETPEINAMAYSSIFGNRICVTRGLVNAYQSGRMDEEELKAILGHEIGHIKNLDCLKSGLVLSWVSIFDTIGTLYTIIGTAISGIGIALGEASGEEGAGWMATLFGWWLVIMGFITKMIAKIASIPAFHLSRRQEYAADAIGAELVNPEKMANALRKMGDLNNELIAKEIASLPYADKWQLQPCNPSWLDRVFDTHPPMEKRDSTLRRISEFL